MSQLRALTLLGLFVTVSAQAGLFSDDDARKQIQQLDERVTKQTQQSDDRTAKLEEASQSQTKSILDLQGQIDALNAVIRALQGQNEELKHGLQAAEKREKDFYVDLDTRLRKLESSAGKTDALQGQYTSLAAQQQALTNSSQQNSVTVADLTARLGQLEAKLQAMQETLEAKLQAIQAAKSTTDSTPADPSDPIPANRTYEAAYAVYKEGNYADAIKAFNEFLDKFPESVYVSNANFWIANAYYQMKEYKTALKIYQGFLKYFPDSAKIPEVLLGQGRSQQALKQKTSAQKTFNQLIAKYPDSEPAAKAKKLLNSAK